MGAIKNKVIKFFSNYYNIAFLILLIVAFSVYWQVQFVDSIWLDETNYTWQAQLIKENPLHLFKINAYHLPALIIAFFNIFLPSFIAGRLMGLVFGIGGLVLVYFIGKQFRNGFVGLLAAFMLAFYSWWRFLVGKALVDVPTAVSILLFTYLLYLFDKKKNWKRLLLLIIMFFFTLTIKVTGIIIIPIVVGFYILKLILYKGGWRKVFEGKDYFKGKKKIVIILSSAVFLFFVYKVVMQYLGHIFNAFIKKFQFTYTLQILDVIINQFGWFVVVFALIGTLICLIYKSKGFMTISLAYILFLFSAIFFYEGIPEIRYLFPLFPLIYLIAAYGIDEVLNFIAMFIKGKIKYAKLILQLAVLIFVFIIIVKPNYSIGESIIQQKNQAYKGYIEAMNWVSDNIKSEGHYVTNFFACCNYNVGLDRNDIRRVNGSGMFETFEDFKAFIEREDNINKTFYLMPDLWETGQRKWLYPMTQEKFEAISSLGFQPVKIVEREVQTQQGVVKAPVIFIFRRN